MAITQASEKTATWAQNEIVQILNLFVGNATDFEKRDEGRTLIYEALDLWFKVGETKGEAD